MFWCSAKRQLARFSFFFGGAVLFFCGAAVVGAAASDDHKDPPVVKTKYGPVKGVWRDGGVAAFYRVPYASSTAGQNRWKPAQPPEPWTLPVGETEPLARAHVSR